MLEVRALRVRLGSFSLGPLDLLFKPGVTALAGPNGSGKSTLLRITAGLIKPDAGSLIFNGEDLKDLSQRKRAGIFSYIPQEIPVAIGFSVKVFVAMGHYHVNRRYYSEENGQAVEEALEAVDLLGRAEVDFNVLSGGEKRRACLARALVQDSQWILMDEPASFLDYRHNLVMVKIIRKLQLDGKRSVILVSHDCSFLASLADDFITLKNGQLYAREGLTQFYDPDFLSGLFDVPFKRTDNKKLVYLDY